MRPRGENIEYDKLRARYDALAAELAEEKQEMEGAYALTSRQADLLTGVVNALRGEPPPDTLWSHHDAAELARKVMAELGGYQRALKVANDSIARLDPVNGYAVFPVPLTEEERGK